MVNIFFTRYPKEYSLEMFDNLLKELPSQVQNRIIRYKNEDRGLQQLISKLLLQKALQTLELSFSLSDLNYTEHGKPFFNNEIGFSISHSEGISVCAIS